MAVFSSITCADMAGVIGGIKSFLLDNGFSISEESSENGLTKWVASKGQRAHHFTAVENSRYPMVYYVYSGSAMNWGSSKDYDRILSASLGIRSAKFTKADLCYITEELVFPCRMDMFILAEADVFFSFKLDEKRYVHLYSGGLDKGIAGNYEGGELFSGSCFYFRKQYSGTISQNNNEKIGMLNTYDTFFYEKYNNRGYYIYRSCVAMLMNGEWCQPYMGFYNSGAYDSYISSNKIYGNLFAHFFNTSMSNTMKFIVDASRNALTGLPTLFPIRFFRTSDDKYLGKVPDIYMCSGAGHDPGSELAIGQYAYRLYPLHNAGISNLFFAVRSS